MMLGVRVAVGRLLAEPALQKLEDDDFTQVGRVLSENILLQYFRLFIYF